MAYASRLYPRPKRRGFTLQRIKSLLNNLACIGAAFNLNILLQVNTHLE